MRSLWTNNEEVIFNASRPIILNGIGDIITRPDLAARALFIGLEVIPDADRKSESKLLAISTPSALRILGALFDALARRSEAPAVDHSSRDATDGRFRGMGDRLRDGVLALWDLYGRLQQQP